MAPLKSFCLGPSPGAKDSEGALGSPRMAGALSTAELAALISEGGPFSPGNAVEGDQMIGTITELLRHNSHPDYVTVMVSESITRDYPGVEGFREAWSDWL